MSMTHIYTIWYDSYIHILRGYERYIHTIGYDLYIHTSRRYSSYIYNLHRRLQNPVCCSVLQCIAVCCSVLQCVAVCCNLHRRLHNRHCQSHQNSAVCVCKTRVYTIYADITNTHSFYDSRCKRHNALSSKFGSVRTTQSIIYLLSLIHRFWKDIFLIVRYKYSKSYSEDFFLQNLILPTRSCGAGFYYSTLWAFSFPPVQMVGRKCFVTLRYQLPRGILGGPALQYFFCFVIHCMIHWGGLLYARLEYIQFTQKWLIYVQFTTHVAKGTMPIPLEFDSVCMQDLHTYTVMFWHTYTVKFIYVNGIDSPHEKFLGILRVSNPTTRNDLADRTWGGSGTNPK